MRRQIRRRGVLPSRDRPQRHTRVDAHIGARMRESRLALGITQEMLAEVLGVTFQQVQKYEEGANQVSAARLA
jgi:DNA-binding transcriptional regulator YiaG